MPSELATQQTKWVCILRCRRCSRVIDFDDVCVPTSRLAEWARCCGEIMELESVERSAV
jgi:hypothetical protein